jgi:hypothetical protein
MFKAISYSQHRGQDVDLPQQLFFILLVFLVFNTFYPSILPRVSRQCNPTIRSNLV